MLLAVLGVGVFLAGLELMITAVALPSIVVSLADWSELRRASWIVNGYLLVYVATMPLAGRLADLWGVRRLFLAALAVFVAGSALAGAAGSLDALIAARMVQALGGGAIVPVATAAASHLFEGHDRPRALGIIGALTFLGMAAGPFVGAAVLGAFHADSALAGAGIVGGPLVALFAPAWRWVFYLNVPIGIVAFAIAWAASGGWETPHRAVGLDIAGAVGFTLGLAGILVGLTLLGGGGPTTGGPGMLAGGLLAGGTAVLIGTLIAETRRKDPFIDVRLFRDRVFSAAALVSALTGYAFATAIIGGAVFVDRVLYGGPPQQQLALGALAGATAAGALFSGFAVRFLPLRLVTAAGLLASAGALAVSSGWTPATDVGAAALALAVFGFGFGLTVTPRSTAAVERAGRAAFGMASATVTVARMIGMAVGLAVLTAYGSTTIERLQAEIFATPAAYQDVLPPELRGRPFRDGLVVDALESWAAGEAARILVGLFLVAGVVTLVAIPPGLLLGGRAGMLADGTSGRPPIRPTEASDAAEEGPPVDGGDDAEPSLAL